MSVLICNTSFAAEVDGELVTVQKGASVREGHPVIAGREEYFSAPATDLDFDPSGTKTAAAVVAPDPELVPELAPEPEPEADPEPESDGEAESKPEPVEKTKPARTRSRGRIG